MFTARLMFLTLAVARVAPEPAGLRRGDNGGIPCAACTILISISTQLAQIYNETSAESLMRICTYLPTTYEGECQIVVYALAPIIEDELYHHLTPDDICYSIGLCYADKKRCHLFPASGKLDVSPYLAETPQATQFPWICYIPGVLSLCQALANTYTQILPGIDIDGDR